MEDPKRMRTKIRLDLKDVRRQIEELEDELKKNKSEENVEAHRKLIEYEKKLKDQYEKITGLSLDQANNLEQKGSSSSSRSKRSPTSAIFAVLGGLLIAWGYYNTVLHSIQGFDPNDLIAYFTGTGASVSGIDVFMASLLYETSMYLVILPIGIGSLFVLFAGIMDQSRGKLFSFLEGIGFLITAGLFSYILYTAPNPTSGADELVALLFTFSLAVIAGGFLLLIGGLSQPGKFTKFLGFVVALLFIISGAQYFVLNSSTNVETELVNRWPWITMPVVIASGIYAFLGLFRFRN